MNRIASMEWKALRRMVAELDPLGLLALQETEGPI
jgi:hypothetical protein